MDGKKLLLVDGSAVMHRAYHAMPGLTDRQGRPTGALYGFVRILLKTMKDLEPTHVAVAFDRREPTFRKEMYIAYQAQRVAMDDELGEQFDRVRELLAGMEVPVYDKAGFEADDVIGTICEMVSNENSKLQITNDKQNSSNEIQNEETQRIKIEKSSSDIPSNHPQPLLRKEGRVDEVIILTGDRDLMQLVTENVKLCLPVKGVNEAEVVGSDEVKERLGVRPDQVVDYKALVGDSSDNYPGVPGVGPKTAVGLLKEFGSFEGVYEAVEKGNLKLQMTNDKQNSNFKLENEQDGSEIFRMANELKDVEGSSQILKQVFDREVLDSEARTRRAQTESVQDDKKTRNSKLETRNSAMADSVVKKLVAGKAAGELSKQLATIKRDVEVDFRWEDCEAVVKQPGRLARVLEEFGFQSLTKLMRLEESVGEGAEQLKLV